MPRQGEGILINQLIKKEAGKCVLLKGFLQYLLSLWLLWR
jgi:hypothetical protein